jgi:ankyrin repeat protein
MLITAAREGLPVTQCLVDHGADVNLQVTERGNPMTPVWAAVEAKHFDVMDYLVENGAAVNATSGQESLLMSAIEKGTLKDVEVLVEHGADVNYAWQGVNGPRNILAFSTSLHHSDETAYLQAHGAHQ